uniref:CRAL/TRIO N-terminal domain-containing protein n=1 Tax=Anopheles coluzzii TaxID=1518534 RepID=A0A8W7Q2A4_ANOCL
MKKGTKAITKADAYRFTLSDELRLIAKEELRETQATRDHALQMLREWAEKNPRIVKIRMDANFFLKFLRAKKFQIPVVQENIERYVLLKNAFEGAFKNLDCRLPKMAKLIDQGYMFALPERDREGRRVIFYRPGVFDLREYTNADMLKIHGICYETLMADEENQIRGFIHAGVGTGIGLPYLTLFTIKEALELEAYRGRLLADDEMSVNLGMYSDAAKEGSVGALKEPLNGCTGASDNSTYGLAGSFRKLEVD